MRWFVEVSRVGDDSSSEQYCVEAKQWQAALQEARKLRGDSGPLSKFSIELLDEGYRAVDPKQKLRFLVAKAPQEAQLTGDSVARAGQSPHLNGYSAPPPASLSAPPPLVEAPPLIEAPPSVIEAPPLVVEAPAPGAEATPSGAEAPRAVSSPPGAEFLPLHAEPYAGVPSSDLSPRAPSPGGGSEAPVDALKPGSLAPSSTNGALVTNGAPLSSGGVDSIPAAPPVPRDLAQGAALPQQNTQPSAALDVPPPSSVLRRREEEPTAESPITYREVIYVVEPGVSRGSVEALLWASFRDLSRELAEREGQKFVQLAVFDHRFEKKPERAPLGTLAWKDWRGNPVITFPWFDGTQAARASMPAPSIKPVPIVRISSSPSSPPPASAEAAAPAALVSAPPAPAPEPEAAAALVEPSAAVTSAAVAPPLERVEVPSAAVAPQLERVEVASAAAAPPLERTETPPVPLTREKLASHPSSPRGSRPGLPAVRRRAGEDLIGELFETLHDLHFMGNVADGAEFVLAAIDSVVPCDAVLVQVFDLNTHNFVVVRAKGPGSMQVLLHRTPDSDPFIHAVMRRPGSVAIQDTEKDPRVLGARWEALGVTPARALCAPVRQGGRYLGLLEVANPMGDAPFHQTEQNAIDYVCAQFAEFLANRPIVLDADVILRA